MKTKDARVEERRTIEAAVSGLKCASATNAPDVTKPAIAPLTENILPGITGSNAAGMTVAERAAMSRAQINIAALPNQAAMEKPVFVKLAATTAARETPSIICMAVTNSIPVTSSLLNNPKVTILSASVAFMPESRNALISEASTGPKITLNPEPFLTR